MDETNQASGAVMWNSKGRSGYGDETIIGNYDDWEGLSMNGRQVKNEITRETRNLSGSEYWNARKANKPEQVTPELWINGRANVEAFKDDEPKLLSKAKQKHIRDKICPQNTTLNNLDLREQELDNAYLAGDIDENEFLELSRALGAKRQRAHKSLMKALGVSEEQFGGYQLDEYQFDSVNPAITEPLSCDEGEEVGLPRVDRERPLFAAVARVKQAFTACNQASMVGVLEAAKKLPKNSDFMFLTRCLGAAIIILLASNY